MRVGLYSAKSELASVGHVMSVLNEVLGERHALVHFPDDYPDASPMRRRRMAEEIVRSCDVIVTPPDVTLQAVRSSVNTPVPLCLLMLGLLPRGGPGLQQSLTTLRASDVLVVNSRADVAIARAMFRNATVRLLPFPYREQAFYPPAPEDAAAMRVRLGIPSRAPLVLYAGRLTIEKNVHTVLKVFAIVRAAVPDAHLVLAGRTDDLAFREFGVYPLDLPAVIGRITRTLDLAGRVHHTGALRTDDLRALYGAADVALNLSLHHDENFGLGQVEAMACGTPVVGTRWGGLQDTIVHGETGYHAGTTATANGVKSNWWEAANRVVQLLRDPERRAAFGRRGTEIARERFSVARHAQLLEAILEDAVYGARRVREVLQGSDFARDLWERYPHHVEQLPPGRRGQEVYALYRRLITPYTGVAEGGIGADQPVSAEQVAFLANPVACNADGTLAVNDAQFPMDVHVPARLVPAVGAALDALGREPVTTVGALMQQMGGPEEAREALGWMLESGLVLRASPALDAVEPALAREAATTPLVSIRRVEHPADIVYVG